MSCISRYHMAMQKSLRSFVLGTLLSTEDFHRRFDVQIVELATIRNGVDQNQRSLNTMLPLIRSLSPMPSKNGIEPGMIAKIHRAASNDDLSLLGELLPYDETDPRLHVEDDQGTTPLHSAAIAGHSGAVMFLCQGGAKVNADDKTGKSPLRLALMQNHVDTAKILVQDFQASTSRTDHDDMTPTQYSDHSQLIMWLLK